MNTQHPFTKRHPTESSNSNKLILTPLSFIVLGLFANFSFAQEATLDPVNVTAQQTKPLSKASDTVKADEIAKQKATTSDTAQLLKNISGVSLYGAGGVSSLPVIRGLADDRLRIKVNGADYIASCPNHMNSPLSYIDPTNVEKIDVYTSITPASVGGDSLGGSIVVESAKPQFADKAGETIQSGELGTFYRSNGNGFGGNAAASFATDKLSLKYSGSYAKSDNYHSAEDFKLGKSNAIVPNTIVDMYGSRTLAGDEVGESRYETTNHALDVAYRKNNHLFDFKVGFQHIPNEGYPNQRMDMTDNKSLQLNLGYKGNYDWGDLDARVYREHTRHKMDFDIDKVYYYGLPPAISAPGMPMDTEGTTLGGIVKGNIALSENSTLKAGLEFQSYRLDDWWPPSPANEPRCLTAMCGMAPNTFWNINNGKRDRYGIFADWDKKWNGSWQSLMGVRVEQVNTDAGAVQGYNTKMAGYFASAAEFNAKDRKKSDTNIDINALARYTPNANSTFEFGVARKTRSPNLYERYSWSKHSMALEMNNFFGDGNGYVGNVDLKPEKAHTLAASYGWKNADGSTQFKIAPFYTHVEDFIDVKRCKESGAMMQSLCSGTAKANSTATGKFVHLEFVNQTAHLYGIDLSARTSLYKNARWGNFDGTLGLNYVRGKNTDTHDNLYNIMPLNTTLTLSHQLKGWNSSIEWQLVKGKKDTSAVRQEIKTAGYGLLNLRTGYTWKNVTLNLGVENVLNKQYSLPLGGAYVGQGYTMSFNAENGGGMAGTSMYGSAVPGAGRSFYAGLNVKF